jgi:hypothetical protein
MLRACKVRPRPNHLIRLGSPVRRAQKENLPQRRPGSVGVDFKHREKQRKSGTRIISNGSNAIYSEQAPDYG